MNLRQVEQSLMGIDSNDLAFIFIQRPVISMWDTNINIDFATFKLDLERAERTIKSNEKEIGRLKAIIEDRL